MKELKVGDLVRVKEAAVDTDLIGKVLPITKIIGSEIWVEGSVSYWIEGTSSLEKVEPQLLKKGTRVKILVDRDEDGDIITCHTGVIEDEECGKGWYGVRGENDTWYALKTSDVEEIREEKLVWAYESTATSVAFTEKDLNQAYYELRNYTPPPCWSLQEYSDLPIKNSPKKGGKKFIMSGLKKATNFIRSLKQPLKNYVRLGWVELVEDEYVVTDSGVAYYMDVVFGLTPAKTLEEYAEKEVARIKKEEKKDEE